MKAPATGTSNQAQGAQGKFSILKGVTEMKLTMQIEKVKLGLTKGIRNNIPAKLLGALVLGAALVAVSATGLVAGQAEASETKQIQTGLGEEWFHPVTGEPIGPLPKVIERSQGVLASPLSFGLFSWGPAEENFHPVTGELSVAAEMMEIGAISPGEEYFHPVTGQRATGIVGMALNGFGMAEEHYHPVTGDLG